MSMKILFIASDNDIGSGAFRSMAKLVELLKKDYNVEILVVLPYQGSGKKILDTYGIDSIYIESYDWIVSSSIIRPKQIVKIIKGVILNPKAIKQIQNIIRNERIDLVHINTTYSYVGAKAALNERIPIVWHLREALEEDQRVRIFNKRYGYYLIKKANKIIAISDFVFEKYINIFGKKLIKVYNGIDEKMYFCKREILCNDVVELLFVGYVCKTKGADQVIKACQRVVKAGYTNIHLNIVGNKEHKFGKNLEDYVNRNGLKNFISFRGVQEELQNYYKKADIMIMASTAEAFGRTTVEAMMAGCLVIGSNSGATPNILGNGIYGVMYHGGDDIELSQKIIKVINNREAYKKIANKGQERAIYDFKAESNAKHIYEEYKKILQI